MRKTLFAAVALAPLWLLASESPALAQKTISSSISTPQNTATDGDITVDSGGSIQPGVTGVAAITVNSGTAATPVAVTNAGSISFNNLNSVQGILIQGGANSVVTNSGTITVSESFTAPDSNSDGVPEAPFASSTSGGRYGIQLTGTTPFVGSITNSGAIVVKGNDSYGISIEGPLTGTLTNSGTITITGDNSVGLREGVTQSNNSVNGSVSGNVLISGTIASTGTNSSAATFAGNVGGSLGIYAALTSTGYGLTTRTTAATTLATIQNTSSEVEQSASTVIVGASVAGGVFLGAAPSYANTSDTTTDRDGDGIVDADETTGTITNYGSQPALLIGSASNITLGGFVATGAYAVGNANNGYGLIIEGTVSGQGVYDNKSATALQIGGLGGTTNLSGGVNITGSVTATSYAANSTAILIGSGATVPTINNSGTITTAVAPPNTTTDTYPSFGVTGAPVTATTIQINANATVTNLINSGDITASVTGDSKDIISAIAVSDASGTLSNVTNTGTIAATFTADALTATVTGTPVTLVSGATGSPTVALDLSNNTSGVTLTQSQAPTIVITTVTTSSVPVVTVSYVTPSPSSITYTTTATVTSTTTGNTTVETVVPASPNIIGDVYLGNGDNTVNLLAGTVTGALSLGNGATSSLTIDNGAIYTGALTYGGASLSVNVANGILDDRSASTYKTNSLNVGAASSLYFAIDPVNNAASTFTILPGGTATFVNGAKLGLTFLSNATSAETFTVVDATKGTLTVGESSAALTGAIPYMFNASFAANPTAGTIAVTISPKTAAQLGLSSNVAGALAPVYQALTLDTPVQAVFLSQYTKAGFIAAYNQILPDYAGGVFQAANAASLAISRATSESNDIENPSGSRGAWVQEITIGVNQGSGQTDGFRGGGVGFVGGVETGGNGLGAFGVTAAFINTSTADQHLAGDNQTALTELELGGYWQGDFNGITADARLGAGYAMLAGRREFVETDSDGQITLDRKNKSSWDGYTLTGHFGLAYRWVLPDRFLGGGWFVQPQSHFDYFRINESSYNENEMEGGPALSLAIASRTGQEDSGTASVTIGRKLGTGIVWRPQLELGVRDVFSGDAGDTTAHFLAVPSAQSFTLTPADIQGTAGIARFKLKASSEYYEIGVEAGGEILSSRYEEGDVKASVRVLF